MTTAHTADTGPRRLLAAIATIVAVAVAVGGVSAVGALGGQHDAPQAGDARVIMRDFTFQPTVVHIAADSGLFVENQDPTRHDLTIDGDIIVDVPGSHARRTTITLTAGRHVLTCSLHPSMTGTVVVSSP